MQIWGIIHFENGIPISKECLDKKYDVRINGVFGTLKTPAINKTFEMEKLANPFLFMENREFNETVNWGRTFSWPSGDSILEACTLCFDISEDVDEIGQKIFDKLGDWASLLVDNFSLAYLTDLRDPSRGKRINVNGVGKYGLHKRMDDVAVHFVGKIEQIHIYIKSDPLLSYQAFYSIINNTSGLLGPRLCYYYLLDSERAIHDGNFRKGILDAATALELAFAETIQQKLAVEKSLKDYIEKQHDSLSKKRMLLKNMNVKIPLTDKDYQDKIEIFRNRTIHGGYNPTFIEARNCFQIVKETLEYLYKSDRTKLILGKDYVENINRIF